MNLNDGFAEKNARISSGFLAAKFAPGCNSSDGANRTPMRYRRKGKLPGSRRFYYRRNASQFVTQRALRRNPETAAPLKKQMRGGFLSGEKCTTSHFRCAFCSDGAKKRSQRRFRRNNGNGFIVFFWWRNVRRSACQMRISFRGR